MMFRNTSTGIIKIIKTKTFSAFFFRMTQLSGISSCTVTTLVLSRICKFSEAKIPVIRFSEWGGNGDALQLSSER